MKELREYGIEPVVADPVADAEEARTLYGVEFVDLADVRAMDAVVLAVAHREFATLTETEISGFFEGGVKTLLDLKGLLDRDEYERAGYLYWRL